MGLNGKVTAVDEISDFAIAYVKSNEELMRKAIELGTIDWRTVNIPSMAHMTVAWAGYNEETVLLQINVRDEFVKRLMKEYAKTSGENRKKRSARDSKGPGASS